MKALTKKEMLSETRAIAKEFGMTFKVDDSVTYNGESVYCLIDRNSKNVILENMTLSKSYEKALYGKFKEIAERNGCSGNAQ